MRLRKLYLACFAALNITAISAQVTVNYEKYPDYSPVLKPDNLLGVAHAKQNSKLRAESVRPSYVNNAETPYFPAVFNQDGGSCGSASRIGYMFTHEINSFRGANASLVENQYPTHFTWLLTNSSSGKEGMAAANGIPNRVTYGGLTYSATFGNQSCDDADFGWMQGYDKWYEAMNNRISRSANFPEALNTASGREAVKNWLWNHNGDEDFHSGGICGIGVASGLTQATIPSTPANVATGAVGKVYVQTWGDAVDHALTIVGYDDRIEFDLNGNNIYGEEAYDEVGAWIIVNSWSSGWANDGFIYCPYKYSCPVGTSDNYWYPEIYYVRKNYRPLRTIKITMEYSKRSELSLSAGISADINSTEPEQTTAFEHFKFAGDGDGDGVDAEVPMLGRWADGLHYEPMEFGYDLTDLSANFDTRKPLKYFFIIDSKSTASGVGKIDACSIIDYEFDKDGIELPFDITGDGVEIQTKGNRTIISKVVTGEPFYAPRNVTISDNVLAWQAPQASAYALKSYTIYKDNVLLATVPTSSMTYSLDSTAMSAYTVTATYNYNGTDIESNKSNSIINYTPTAATSNITRSFSTSGFNVPNLGNYSNATIEFWLRPSSFVDWNQQIGPGWGTFLMHSSSSKELTFGWSTSAGGRTNTPNNTFALNRWNHVAVVIKGNVMKAYIDGVEKASLTSTGYSGLNLNGAGMLQVGSNDSRMSGRMDEFRIWDEARTEAQINAYMKTEIANPANESHLLVYYKMDEVLEDGVTKLHDALNARNAVYLTSAGHTTSMLDKDLLSDNSVLKAQFSVAEPPYYVGQAISFKNQSTPNAAQLLWTAEGAGVENLNVANPELIFTKSGEQAVNLKIMDTAGNSADTTMVLSVNAVPAPVAKFNLTSTEVPAGERVSFNNVSDNLIGCQYQWTMVGADTESATTTNAGASYSKSGTYTVTLTVTNEAGSSSISHDVIVTDVAPKAAFAISPSVLVKGETTYLVDKSKYAPTELSWILRSTNHIAAIQGGTTSYTPSVPGQYDVTLTASNAQGSNSLTETKALTVCNADALTGLNFTGANNKVLFSGPFAQQSTPRFTIDWWMYPTKLENNCNQMGDESSTVLMYTNAAGAMTLTVGGSSVSSANGFVLASQWHHYAVSYSYGVTRFYRDGKLITSVTNSVKTCPAWASGFAIGSADAPMTGMIDEFRIWDRVLTETNIQNYCNQPIEDISAAETTGLLLYYQCNQSSGDVKDATSNNYTGLRTGFGPDGDAWNSSLGVFNLNFTAAKTTDCTSTYLTNYKEAFLTATGTVNSAASSRFRILKNRTSDSGWVLENADTTGTVITGFHVDGNKNSAMTCTTEWDGFANTLSNHKAYQVLTLPAGAYEFDVTEEAEFAAGASYMVVALGEGLPLTNNLESEALAYAPMSNKTLTFVLTKESEVSLGFLINMSGLSCITVKSLALKSLDSELIKSDGLDAIAPIETPKSTLNITINNGFVKLSTKEQTNVRVVDVNGFVYYHGKLNGEETLRLQKGIYLINGQKFVVM